MTLRDSNGRRVDDLEERNEARGGGLPAEEPRDARKAGGGTVGASQGGAQTGRSGARPENVSDRERKPRDGDKA